MIIYNITSKVGGRKQHDWLDWIRKVYIPEIIATGTFYDFRICELLEQEDPDGATYAIQFFTDSMENYKTFQRNYADRMGEKVRDLFGEDCLGFCTLLKVIS